MADYPTSVYAPSAKNNGDVIQASFFNNPDAEITAVENALKNGLQHALTVSTGGLTVSTGNTVLGQNLSVAGLSTLATGLTVSTGVTAIGGTLDVAGASTFHGPVTFSSGVTFAGSVSGGFITVPTVRVTIAADQNLAPGQFTGLSWPVESYDDFGAHSTASNSSRLVFADSTGKYRVWASVNVTNASSGAFIARLLLDDSTTTVIAANGFAAASALNIPIAVYGELRVASTASYATVQVYNGGASTNSVTSTGNYVTAFGYSKVSS
jgi:hypothetical protein